MNYKKRENREEKREPSFIVMQILCFKSLLSTSSNGRPTTVALLRDFPLVAERAQI